MARLVALGASLILLAAFAGPAIAAPGTVRAVIHEDYGRRASARPCEPIPDGVRCAGDGIVPGVGRVTSSADYTASDIVPRTITLADGSTIELVETYGEQIIPGNSQGAPGSQTSFGNPSRQAFTWVIVGGTAGVTGSGTGLLVSAGDTLTFTFLGAVSAS